MTRRGLRQAGMGVYEHLFMFPNHMTRTSNTIAAFKMDCAVSIARIHNYIPMLTVGDCWCDLLPSPLPVDYGELDPSRSFIIQINPTMQTLLKLGHMTSDNIKDSKVPK